eukprot:366402-Chlamydomonas_euryale.AAC.7
MVDKKIACASHERLFGAHPYSLVCPPYGPRSCSQLQQKIRRNVELRQPPELIQFQLTSATLLASPACGFRHQMGYPDGCRAGDARRPQSPHHQQAVDSVAKCASQQAVEHRRLRRRQRPPHQPRSWFGHELHLPAGCRASPDSPSLIAAVQLHSRIGRQLRFPAGCRASPHSTSPTLGA